jgi:hypothetical protein
MKELGSSLRHDNFPVTLSPYLFGTRIFESERGPARKFWSHTLIFSHSSCITLATQEELAVPWLVSCLLHFS